MDPFGSGVDLQRMCFSVKMYVKTKELDPMGGGGVHRKIFVCRSANAQGFWTGGISAHYTMGIL